MVYGKYFRKSIGTLMGVAAVMLVAGSSPVAASSLSTITLATFYPDGRGVDADFPTANAVSADGRISVFSSSGELVPGDTNRDYDAYAYDKVTNKIELISRGRDGQPANGQSSSPVVSANGRYVAFTTTARNMAGENMHCIPFQPCHIVVVHDRVTKKNTAASVDTQGARIETLYEPPSISGDGRFVAFPSMTAITPGDTNNSRDILVRDLQAGVTTIVSVGDNGRPGNWASHEQSVSGDGRFVVFRTGSRLVPEDTNGTEDVYVRDTQAGTTRLASVTDGGQVRQGFSGRPDISADGRFVVFFSDGKFVQEDTYNIFDIYVRDLQAGRTHLVSVASNGTPANGPSSRPTISGDGRFVAFSSEATNLVAADTNGRSDIFFHDRFARVTRRVSVAPHNGPQLTGQSHRPSISDDGKSILFSSTERTLYPGARFGTPLFLSHNPVAHIPFYDSSDLLDLF